ncbi:MAG: hypothetical protein NT166_01725 [Candidatus Aminicenantes bacterium]|nr:hypothetical protein [Candidatus Aminicenantes bacterium]
MTFQIPLIDARFVFTVDAHHFVEGTTTFDLAAFGFSDQILSSLASHVLVLTASRTASAFQLISRPEKNTLPQYDFAALAPFEVCLREPIRQAVGIFNISLDRFLISREGTLAYPFSVCMAKDTDDRSCADVSSVVSLLTEVRRIIPESLCRAIQLSFRILMESSEPSLACVFEQPDAQTVLRRCHSFELFDFSSKIPKMLTSTDAKALTGFLRMTRQGVWEKYTEDTVQRVFEANLGNRRDELWIALGNRFFRMHPESTTRRDVRLWFEDLHLAVIILLLKIAGLEYLCYSIRESLRKDQFRPQFIPRNQLSEAWNHLVEIQNATARAADPRFLERNVTHSFFRNVLRAIEDQLGYQDLVENASRLLADYRANVTAMASHSSALSAIDVAASTERLTRLVLWLTAVALIVMGVQLILALR